MCSKDRSNSFQLVTIIVLILVLSGCATAPRTQKNSEFSTLLERASSQYESGLLTEAEASYRQVTNLRPDYYEPWLKLGNIYVRTGQLEAAVRMFEKCTGLRPDDVRGWSNLSLTRLKQSLAVLDVAQQYFPSDSTGGLVIKNSRESLIKHLVQ
ncbi:MAG: tetratricopeptide repeat protein [Pseudomonadota bacterium]|nr:tetratricopeptide repeat protein [Pseudomonadota bacterium]